MFDTNVVLSALVFPGGRLAWPREAWRSGSVTPLASKVTVLELVRALAYPRFALMEQERDELLADYLPFLEIVESSDHSAGSSLECRDPHDQGFLDLALAAGADALVTGDQDLLILAQRCPLPILTPAELGDRL